MSLDKMKLKTYPNPFSRETATKNLERPYKRPEGGRQSRDNSVKKYIILLTDPNENQVLSGEALQLALLQKRKRLIDLNKTCTGKVIDQLIRGEFCNFLGSEIQYELLFPTGKNLFKLEYISSEELNGETLLKASARLPIYIRPTEKLQIKSDVDENHQRDNSSYKNPPYSKNLNKKFLKVTKSCIAPKALSKSVSIGQILKQHTEEKAIDENMQYHIICKTEIRSCVLRTVTRPTFSPLKKPTVMFAEEQRSGGAFAVKGSTPKFFRLVLLYLKENMFKGPENAKELNFSNKFLQDGSYYYCGMIIAMSLFHGGPGPSFFSEQFYKRFCEDNVNCEKTAAIKKVRQQLEATSNLGQLNDILSFLSNLDQTGCPSTVRDFSMKKSVIQGFLDFHCETEALQQFIEGFQTLTMYTVVQKHCELFQKVFCCKNKKLSVSDVATIFKYYYSEEHSETRKMENRTFGYFGQFLQDCEENVVPITLEDVMILITGLECEPPLGFRQTPRVKFLKDPNEKLPIAKTSEMSLFLPTVHENYDNFKTFFCEVWK